MRKKDHEKTLLLFDIITVDKTTTYKNNILYTVYVVFYTKIVLLIRFYMELFFFFNLLCSGRTIKKEYDKNNGNKVIIRIRFWRYNIIRNY